MKKTNSDNPHIDCFQCEHFFVTWDANQPRGCKAFGFKTKQLPSVVVFESSGQPCMKFRPKRRPPPSDSGGNGWIA
ncbi:uracil-DNA glycosylase [Thiomicrospira sp. S5]|uniref:uracil-DNA glycosylase n=1 Tax=Thiomicrospira sp. S5 TaxID=1803865 RepID=UPI000F89F351|nr:uracil-DNA glycosylase [Thiomicrospira sp. S5]AZR81964.1 uracil-DNA glycosylase [Thiomicrospira sp. S5]